MQISQVGPFIRAGSESLLNFDKGKDIGMISIATVLCAIAFFGRIFVSKFGRGEKDVSWPKMDEILIFSKITVV